MLCQLFAGTIMLPYLALGQSITQGGPPPSTGTNDAIYIQIIEIYAQVVQLLESQLADLNSSVTTNPQPQSNSVCTSTLVMCKPGYHAQASAGVDTRGCALTAQCVVDATMSDTAAACTAPSNSCEVGYHSCSGSTCLYVGELLREPYTCVTNPAPL